MDLQVGTFGYAWQEGWGGVPGSCGFSHHGMAVCRDGTIFTGDITDPRVHVLSVDGELLRSFDVPVCEVHGLSFAEEHGESILLVSDNGHKAVPSRSGESSILKCDLYGNELGRVTRDRLGYSGGDSCGLTACVQDPDTSHLWVADGYGSSRVHCLALDGRLLLSLDGTESGLAHFKTPHAVWVDRRKGYSELYIADRANHRVLVYSTDGKLLRNLDQGFRFPSAFASFGDTMVVGELAAGMVLLDGSDHIVGRIGVHREATERPGWPNCKDADGNLQAPTSFLAAGHFNSPHGLAADEEGNIYVSEWLLGGRYIRLKRIR